ncbi:unnamed protein product, partial [Didymodactylos carnosus]
CFTAAIHQGKVFSVDKHGERDYIKITMATIQNEPQQRTAFSQMPTSTNIYLAKADEWLHKLIRGTPNGLTLSNLTCGLFSLIMSMNGFHRFGSLFILLAGVCDVFDGRLARYLKIEGPMGAQLDSLADIVSFGVAPAILAHSISQWSFLMIIAFVAYPLG